MFVPHMAVTMHIWVLAACLSGFCCWVSHAESSTINDKDDRPHIVLVIVDDMGSADMGRHGSGIFTPTMDELAHDGRLFTNAYVLPYCSPTRATLLSGRYPLHTGFHTILNDWEEIGLPLGEETIAEVLHRAGYQTHAVGKWHIGHARWEYTPTFRGFQSFFGYYLGAQDYFTHYKDGATGRGYDLHYDRRPNCGEGCSQIVDERGNYSTHVFTRKAVELIEKHERNDQPLFLYLAYQAVHHPDEVPASYREVYQNRTDWSDRRKTYAGMLSCADEGIANVTAALRRQKMWKNTIMIITTDNGGPTDVCMVQGSTNTGRGGKCTLWEGGTRGDAILAGPALDKFGIRRGQPYDNLFHVVDWLPTLATIAEAKPAGKPLDGVDHLSALRGKSHPPREELFVGYAMYQNALPHEKLGVWYGPAIRWRQWKLIQGSSGGPEQDRVPPGTPTPAQGGNVSSPYLLYNLDDDPTEQVNLVDENPLVFEILRGKLAYYQESFVPPFHHEPWNDTICNFNGPTQTQRFGPTWLPWCRHAKEYVFAINK